MFLREGPSERVLRGRTLSLLFTFLLFPSLVSGSKNISGSYTAGTGNYRSLGLNTGWRVSERFSLSAGYSSYTSDSSTAPVPTYSGSFRRVGERLSWGGSFSSTPALDNASFKLGGDVSLIFGAPDRFQTTLGFAPDLTTHAMDTSELGIMSRKIVLPQWTLELRIAERVWEFNEAHIYFANSVYPSPVQKLTSMVNQGKIRSIPGVLGEVLGFTKTSLTVGGSRDFHFPLPWYLGLDINRLVFLEDGVSSNSWTVTAGSTLWGAVDCSLSYNSYKQSNAVSASTYTGFTVGYFW